ncbi:hypothetical protein B0H13DRAFT_1897428 [Mycena leptocephala]|nr:hypothetical protein B0H13DRAFT_1897428 [Mycena leptocephala]
MTTTTNLVEHRGTGWLAASPARRFIDYLGLDSPASTRATSARDTIIPGVPTLPICAAILLAVPLDPEPTEQGPGCTAELARDALPRALPPPSVFDDAPTATAPTSIDNKSAPAPVPPPLALPSASTVRASGFALPGASSRSSAHGSTSRPGSADSKFVEGIPSPMPAPAAAEDSSPAGQSEGLASPMPVSPNTPTVPGLGLSVVPLHAPQGVIAPGAGVAKGKDAPLPLDAPHFTVVDSGAVSENTETAPPAPSTIASPHPPAPSTVTSPPLPPAPATATHDDSGADEVSGSGSGSDAADAGAEITHVPTVWRGRILKEGTKEMYNRDGPIEEHTGTVPTYTLFRYDGCYSRLACPIRSNIMQAN